MIETMKTSVLARTSRSWQESDESLWGSLWVIVVSLFSGLILFSLGVLAEYLGIVVTMALGKPLYLITSRPNRGGPRRP